MPVDEDLLREAEQAAREVSIRAHAPYSGFPVGAAVVTASGRIYSGCNVENASYGLTICAERAAAFAAVAGGDREIRAAVIYTPTPTPTAPCGACRQVLNEFGPETEVISVCDGPARTRTHLAALLPAAFGPGNLSLSPSQDPGSKPRKP